jgi:hypothetical protein
MTLFLKHKWLYIAVKTDCNIYSNIGAISLSPGTSIGALNVKDELRRTLAINPTQLNPPPTSQGNMKGGGDGGTGYVGWVDCGSIKGATAYIGQHVNVQYCPVGCVIATSCGKVVPCPQIETPQNCFEKLKARIKGMIGKGMTRTAVVFRGEGTIPVPEWFEKWCKDHNIEIGIRDDTEFDGQYPPDTWTDVKGNLYSQP